MIEEVKSILEDKKPSEMDLPRNIRFYKSKQKGFYMKGVWGISKSFSDLGEDLSEIMTIEEEIQSNTIIKKLNEIVNNHFLFEQGNGFYRSDLYIFVSLEKNSIKKVEEFSYESNNIPDWSEIRNYCHREAIDRIRENTSKEDIYHAELRPSQEGFFDSDIFFYVRKPQKIYSDYESIEDYLEQHNQEALPSSDHFHIHGDRDLNEMTIDFFEKNYSDRLKLYDEKYVVRINNVKIEEDYENITDFIQEEKISLKGSVMKEIN